MGLLNPGVIYQMVVGLCTNRTIAIDLEGAWMVSFIVGCPVAIIALELPHGFSRGNERMKKAIYRDENAVTHVINYNSLNCICFTCASIYFIHES